MSQNPTPLNYETPPPAPPLLRNTLLLKWLMFGGGILTTLMSVESRGTVGCAAGGLWVAFALIHVQEMRGERQ